MPVVIVILLIVAAVLACAFLYINISRKLFRKIFVRPHPVSRVDRSPEKIDQSTIFGRGKNWFYTTRNEYINVRIDSFDKTKLSGYFRPSSDRSTRSAVIFLHGYNEHPSECAAYAKLMMKQIQCHVLITHMRGHGVSGGKYCTYGVYESVDLMRWIDFIRRQTGKDTRIYIYGRCMGAVSALLAAATDELRGNIAGIIADSPYDTFETGAVNFMSIVKPHLKLQLFMPMLNRMAKSKFGFDMSMCDCAINAEKIRVPVLFFSGGNDKICPPDVVRSIYDEVTSPKRLVVIDHADHLMGYDKAPSVYEKEVRHFVEKCVERLILMGKL
ncbi:MAG: alpha/beta fold hydrolase [Clostridiales bacterium]|nr:alpha/beta fold hydrolase [Clostridiales bacterium]